MSFDIEKHIAKWKQSLRKHSGIEPGDLEELELHLRDAIDDLSSQGMTEEDAFNKVVEEKLGKAQTISEEYHRARLKENINPTWTDNLNPFQMLPTNFKIAIRSLLRNQGDSLLNIAGLTISIVAGILIFQFINFETSYDQFFENNQRIHRVAHRSFNNSDGSLRAKFASTFYAVAPEIKEEIPEIEASTRIFRVQGILSREITNFRENDIYYAAADFFEVFSQPLIRGNAKDLDLPGTIFLSETMARKYFGEADAFGQKLEVTLIGGFANELEVRGIFKDFPENSHFKSDAFLSHQDYVDNLNNNNVFGTRTLADVRWRLVGFYQYVLLRKNVDADALHTKLDEFMYRHRGKIDDARGVKNQLFFERLDKIHLSEKLSNEIKAKGDTNIILFLRIVFVTILLLGWINYINLTTAKSINRAKEVGVRKVMGSSRSQLIWKFITESLVINFVSIVLAGILVVLLIPYFHQLIDKNIFDYFEEGLDRWTIFISVLFVGVVVSSLYPALVLSSFRPVAILKGKFKNSKNGVFLRKGLVTFQFSISLMLLIAIYVVFMQIKFMQNHDLGFTMDQTLVVRGPSVNDSTTNLKLKTFRDIVSGESSFAKATVSTSVPGGEIQFRTASKPLRDNNQGEDAFLRRVIGYDDFIDFYGIELIAGRVFSAARPADLRTIILNRTAVELYGFESPKAALNERIAFVLSDTFEIIGVVEDFAQRGLQVAYEPTGIQMTSNGPGAFISTKVSSDNINSSIKFLEEQYAGFFPDDPFEYFFLDEYYNRQYQSEEKYGKILGLFTLIAVIIASLGLLGLTSFMVRLRLKEIAVRKVLGATIGQIFGILTREYFYLIGVACVIGLPLTYYGANLWLDTFAFRAPLGIFIFIIPVVAVCFITFITIGRLSFKAATSNPVNSLKEE